MSIKPFPHQIDAIKNMKRIESESSGGFLCHEMGLGKTITMALYIKENRGEHPELIICPFAVINNWEHELKRVDKDCSVLIYGGANRTKKLKTLHQYDYVIATYFILSSNELVRKNWNRIILDESHYIKNGLSGNAPRCAKGAFSIANCSKYRWCISGTPFNNRMNDIASQCKFIGTAPYNEKMWWKLNCNNKEKVKKWKDKFVLLKNKEGLLEPQQYHEVIVEPTSMEQSLINDLRAKVAKNFREWKKAEGRQKNKFQMQIMSLIMRLRIYSNSFYCDEKDDFSIENAVEDCSKLKRIINDIDKWILKDKRKGLVIFTQFTSFITVLKKCIEEHLIGIDVYTYTGDMNSDDREITVNIFNHSEKPRVILVSLMAGGVGLSLHHGSSTVFICEPCYNPFIEKQAEERVHRLGQKNKVNVIKYFMSEGVENWMNSLKMKKLSIASTIGMAKKSQIKDGFCFSDVEKLFCEHVRPTDSQSKRQEPKRQEPKSQESIYEKINNWFTRKPTPSFTSGEKIRKTLGRL